MYLKVTGPNGHLRIVKADHHHIQPLPEFLAEHLGQLVTLGVNDKHGGIDTDHAYNGGYNARMSTFIQVLKVLLQDDWSQNVEPFLLTVWRDSRTAWRKEPAVELSSQQASDLKLAIRDDYNILRFTTRAEADWDWAVARDVQEIELKDILPSYVAIWQSHPDPETDERPEHISVSLPVFERMVWVMLKHDTGHTTARQYVQRISPFTLDDDVAQDYLDWVEAHYAG